MKARRVACGLLFVAACLAGTAVLCGVVYAEWMTAGECRR